jgi:hypothetical protein
MSLVVALCLAATGVACAAGSGSDAGPTVTAATNAGAAAAADVQAMSDYSASLIRWGNDFEMIFGRETEEALTFGNPQHPTGSELLRARQLLDAMRGSVSELRKINPPEKVAQPHGELYAALAGEVSALERYVNAVDWGSERDAELAWRATQRAHILYVQAVNALRPYVGLPGVKQN